MPKRRLSSNELDGEERRTRARQVLLEEDVDAPRKRPSAEDSDQIQVTVSFRSSSKASRNDPTHNDYWWRLLDDTVEGGKSSSEHILGKSLPTSSSPTTLMSSNAANILADSEHPHPAVLAVPEQLGDDIQPHTDEATSQGVGEADLNSLEHHDSDDVDDYENWLGGEDSHFGDECSDRSSLDEFADWSWLEQIDGFATEGREKVAICDAKLIRRDQNASAFWIEMDEPTSETSDLAFELFDRYGRLDPKYYKHDFKQGTRVWGPEMDYGDILLFESLNVSPPRRRRGLGTKIVKAILDKARETSEQFFALVSPGYLTQELSNRDGDSISEHLAAAKQFWRSLGFRRVGTSSWFAFVDDPDHLSRRLDVSEDWDYPEELKRQEPVPNATQAAFTSLCNPQVSGDQCVRDIQKSLPADTNDASWSLADEDGNTVLHVAAMSSKPEAVDYIFSRRPDLASVRNREGDNPLEALQANLESERTRSVFGPLTRVCSDRFTGFRQCSIACVGVLSNTQIFDLDTLSPEALSAIYSGTDEKSRSIPEIDAVCHALRLKYGCTCDKCIGEFLSPRMRLALLCQAEIQHDLMMEGIHDNGPGWVMVNERKLSYLPTSVKENLKTNKSMREGFANICSHIAKCLKQNKLPIEANVRYIHQFETREWPPVTKSYLQRGGTVDAVATMLFEQAMYQDECSGNGHHQRVYEDEIKELSQCRNDHEFGFVSGVCGYKRVSTVRYVDMWGRPTDTN